MKKILKYVLLIILIFPIFIEAATYDDALELKKDYITKYKNYDSYINSEGSFLNIKEYNLSKSEGSKYSYLASGTSFWLEDDATCSDGHYVLSDSLKCNKEDNSYGIKLIYNIESNVSVSGKGTQSNPWEFLENYKLYVDTIDTTKGTVTPSGSEYITKGENINKEYTIETKPGYENPTVLCTNSYKPEIIDNKFTINSITENTSCNVDFESKIMTVTLDHNGGSGDNLINTLYYEYNSGWYLNKTEKERITELSSLPTKSGYQFMGYYNGETQIIDKNGKIISEQKLLEDTTLKAKYVSDTKPVRIYYHMNGGSYYGTSSLTSKDSFIACNDKTQGVIEENGYSCRCDENSYYYDVVEEGESQDLSNFNNSGWIKISRSYYYARYPKAWYLYKQNNKDNSTVTLSQTKDYSYDTLKSYAEDKGDHYKIIVYVNWKEKYYCYFKTGYCRITLKDSNYNAQKSICVYHSTYSACDCGYNYGKDGLYFIYDNGTYWYVGDSYSYYAGWTWSSSSNFSKCYWVE